MKKIKVNHYTDTLIYTIDMIIKDIKADLNQYIANNVENITAEQFVVLDTIYCHNEVCQQDIATILSKDKSNTKRIVEILEKNNYVTRKTGRKNNRLVNFLEITQEGKKIVDDNIENIKKHIEEYFSDIDDDEIELLKKLAPRFKKTNLFK